MLIFWITRLIAGAVSGGGTNLAEVDTREPGGQQIPENLTGIRELVCECKVFWMGEWVIRLIPFEPVVW
ncbi:MAG: hypothetical protein ABSH44_06725 [Bryobacteraceae bacterium]|jgi:hypothetical protein